MGHENSPARFNLAYKKAWRFVILVVVIYEHL